MLATCSRSLPNQLGPRFLVSAGVLACSRESAAGPATDISGLLLLKECMSGSEVNEKENGEDEGIEPEIGKGQSFGEGAHADRLKPSRWKCQTDYPPRAGQ